MKKLLGWIAVVVFAAGAAVAQPFLGVNLNATPDELDPRLMQQSGATWVRTMVDVVGAQNAVSDGKRASALNMTRWQTFIQMGQRGTAKTILSLKFDFRSAGQHPPKPGSTEEAALFAFMDYQILDILAPTTSIIVSGNEPFVNTMPQDERKKVGYGGVPVVLFYQRVTEHVQDYLVKNGLRSRNQLYFGAFTNLEKPDMQSDPAVQAMLAYAAGNKDVDGIDVHAHVASLDEISTIMNFVRGFTAKPLIVTEYTYVKAQRAGLTQGLPLGAGFAETYNLDPAMTELDFLRCAVFRRSKACAGQPITQAEWDDFMSSRSWTIDHFLLKANHIFASNGVAGSTFGLMGGRAQLDDLQPGKMPWYLGFLYAPGVLGDGPDGLPLPNYQYLDDFRQLNGQGN